MKVAGDELGVLEGRSIDFLRDALGRAMREPQQLYEVIDCAKRAAAGSSIHEGEQSGGK